jgi:multidrug resistance efflux pump
MRLLLASFLLVFQCVMFVPAIAQDAPATTADVGVATEIAVDNATEIPFRENDFFAKGFLARVIIVTMLGIALVLMVVWMLRRFLFRNLPSAMGASSITLIDFKKLTPRMSVYVIEVDQKRFTLVESGDSLVHLSDDTTSE